LGDARISKINVRGVDHKRGNSGQMAEFLKTLCGTTAHVWFGSGRGKVDRGCGGEWGGIGGAERKSRGVWGWGVPR